MTAPLRFGDPITVEVALGARGYDIVIGRGLLASLGERIAAVRPKAKAALVTDDVVAKLYLAAAEAALTKAGIATAQVIVPAGEGSKSFPIFEQVWISFRCRLPCSPRWILLLEERPALIPSTARI
jgi:3-dehydroquinate synthetase